MVEVLSMILVRRLPACLAAALFGFLLSNFGISAAMADEADSDTPVAATSVAEVEAAESQEPVTTSETAAPTTTDAPTTTTVPEVVLEAASAPAASDAPVATATAASAPAATPAPAPASAPAPAPEPAPAPAPEPAPAAAPTPAERGAEALARISYPWQRLGYSISFEDANPNLLGKADCGSRRIYVYVRPTQTIQQIAFVTAFELGHAVDCGFMNDTRRSEWASIRGFAPGWTWFPGCVCSEDNFGSGDISMVFATWLVPDGGYRWRSNLAGPPSGEQLNQLMPYLRP